ncbi:MAG: cell division protein FtsL [bacterium]
MKNSSGVLLGSQRIDVFSKKKTDRIQMHWSYLFVVLFCIFVGIFAVWERVQYVGIGYDIQVMKQEHEKLLQDKRELLLEYNTSISLDKVEERARKELRMQVPAADQIFYVKESRGRQR